MAFLSDFTTCHDSIVPLKSWWTHHHWAIVILNAWNTAQCSAFFTPLKGCQLSQKEYWVKVPQQCNWALFRKFAQRACQENNSTLKRARSLSLFVDKFAMAKKAPQPDCQNWAGPFLVKNGCKVGKIMDKFCKWPKWAFTGHKLFLKVTEMTHIVTAKYQCIKKSLIHCL